MVIAASETQKAGTTSLANCLKLHPAISGPDGLPWHEALSKESHYFNGVFGCNHASSALLCRSFFPTILCRWWAEHVKGVKKVQMPYEERARHLTCCLHEWLGALSIQQQGGFQDAANVRTAALQPTLNLQVPADTQRVALDSSNPPCRM